MYSNKIRLGAVVAALACSVGGLALAAPAQAAQSEQMLTCDGHQLTIRTPDNNSSDMGGWSAAQVSGDGHLIPTTFAGSLYDVTVGQVVFQFSETKGAGNGNHNQQTVSCTQETSGTLADFVGPGDELPPGTALTDEVTFTITATAVPQR